MAYGAWSARTLAARILSCIVVSACLALWLVEPVASLSQVTFVPAVQRVDMVHDPTRSILYITNGSYVLRYNTSTQALLTPITLGGGTASLRGMDLSPDGNTLVVADAQYVFGISSWVWVIDIPTGTVRQLTFAPDFYEAGTWAVAFGNDGGCLVSSRFAGSGWVPLRRLDPSTGTFTKIATVRQDSMVSASGDGSVIALEESNSSDGPVGRYRVSDGNWLSRSGYTYGTSWFNFEIAANKDGTQYSVPTYDGTFIYDADLLKTGAIVGGYASAGQPVGVAYHPSADVVYYAWSGTSQVRAYDSATLSLIRSYDVGQQFVWVGNQAYYNGRIRVSRDGSLLFVTVGDPYYSGSPALGVKIVRLAPSLTADPKIINTNEDTTSAVTLSGASSDGSTPGFEVTTAPSHGSLSGVAPNLVYTPDHDYNGADSFAYRAVLGTVASAPATVSITVNPVNDPPAFVSGGDVSVNEDSGLYSAPWASSISPGPSDEAGQTVSFVVSNNNISLFTAQPAIDATGRLTFTPAPNAFGTATVTVQLKDNGGVANGGSDTSASQTFTLTVVSVNDPPVALDDYATIRKHEAVVIAVLANDRDVEGGPLTVVSVTRPARGTVAINPDGTLTYVPSKSFQGTDSFQYTISDPEGATATATVHVTVSSGKGR